MRMRQIKCQGNISLNRRGGVWLDKKIGGINGERRKKANVADCKKPQRHLNRERERKRKRKRETRTERRRERA